MKEEGKEKGLRENTGGAREWAGADTEVREGAVEETTKGRDHEMTEAEEPEQTTEKAEGGTDGGR